MTAATNAGELPRTTFRTRLLILGATLLRYVPTGLSQRVAYGLGGLLYRVQPARRRLVRANLQRVVTWLAAHDMARPETAAAAHDARALDRLTRAAFGHYVRSYLESAILPMFYRDRAQWAEVMRSAIAINGSYFTTERMMREYAVTAYC